MGNIAIHFVREGITFTARAGQTLLEVEVAAGLQPDAPCGGLGTCGKCLADIRRPGAAAWETVKACQTRLQEDLEVRTVERNRDMRVLSEGDTAATGDRSPWVECLSVQVPPCRTGESLADWTRLRGALDAAAGPRDWTIDVALLGKLGPMLRKTGGKLAVAVAQGQVLDLWEQERPYYMAAFDIGTTSIAGYLIEGPQLSVAAKAGMLNPQAQYGADVIMRANYALEHGAGTLADCVHQALDQLIGQLCDAAGIQRQEILAVSVVGNTCMHHLFLGISPDSLAYAPYNPTVSDGLILRAADYQLHTHPRAVLLVLPVIAGFVGADTIGCLLSGGWDTLEDLTLMIDIGTNGELVLGTRERMIACSTAAGPAFEGAKIQCGMRGADGAVDHVYLENGQVTWHVIGDGEAQGICGSGLIDLIAVLRRTGDIDESGKLTCGKEYRLGETRVVLTQRDVREVQLAKGAICAGICLLAEQLGVSLEDVKQVTIAGAFGNYMDPQSACDIGLIPLQLRSKTRPVGNAAGEGAKFVLESRDAWERAQMLARKADFLELATLPVFQDTFVDSMEFPELLEEATVC